MRRAIIATLVTTVLGAVPTAILAQDGLAGYYEVVGVEDDEMLKMRAGPGTGYKVIVGLPNGTILRIHSCDETGATRWCKASLKQARKLKGYVSWHYLREF